MSISYKVIARLFEEATSAGVKNKCVMGTAWQLKDKEQNVGTW